MYLVLIMRIEMCCLLFVLVIISCCWKAFVRIFRAYSTYLWKVEEAFIDRGTVKGSVLSVRRKILFFKS